MKPLTLLKAIRRKGAGALCLALCALGLCASASAQPTIITFDAPGAGTGMGQGTFGMIVTPAGTLGGVVIDANNVSHGFVRAPGGAITTFDVPGAGTAKALARWA